MSRILVTPRSPTRNPSPALQDLVDDGYELLFSRPSETPDEAEMLSLHCPMPADGNAVQHAGAIAGLTPPRSPLPGAADGRSHPMIVT